MRRTLLLIPLILAMAIALFGARVATAHASCGYIQESDLPIRLAPPIVPGDGTVQQNDGTVFGCGADYYVKEAMMWQATNGSWFPGQYNGSNYLDRKPDTGSYTGTAYGGSYQDKDMYVPSRFDTPGGIPCNYNWKVRAQYFSASTDTVIQTDYSVVDPSFC